MSDVLAVSIGLLIVVGGSVFAHWSLQRLSSPEEWRAFNSKIRELLRLPDLYSAVVRLEPKLGYAGVLVVACLLLTAFVADLPRATVSQVQSWGDVANVNLQAVNAAVLRYRESYGSYPLSLAQLKPSASGESSPDAAGLLDPILASGRKGGFEFKYMPTLTKQGDRTVATDYVIDAWPRGLFRPNFVTFRATSDGAIKYKTSWEGQFAVLKK